MELKEFVRLDPDQIRRDKELMQLFVEFYEAAFSFIPKCVGCAFKKGFKKLKKYAQNSEKNIIFKQKVIQMETKTFQLKKQYHTKILTYKKEGVIYRKYGNQLTEEFAKELVKAGKEDLFVKLPEVEKTNEEILGEIEVNSETLEHFGKADIYVSSIDYYNSLDHRTELLVLYKQAKERTGKKAESNKKADIIAFLIENEG